MTRSVFAIATLMVLQTAGADAIDHVSTDSTSGRKLDSAAAGRPIIWMAALAHDFSRFSNERPSWRSDALQFRARFVSGTTAVLEGGRVSRHGNTDVFAALDVYRVMSRAAYVNLRVTGAPGADISPRLDVFSEAFYSPWRGWEVSGGARFAVYADARVFTAMTGVARYVGAWYLRVRNSVTPADGSVGYAVLLTGRRYFGSADEFIGVSLSSGREVVAFSRDVIEHRSSRAVSATAQRFVRKGAGLRVGVEYVSDGGLSRWGVTAGAFVRW